MLIQRVYYLILFATCCIGMARFRKLTIPFRTLFYSTIVMFLLEMIAELLTSKYGHNMLAYHLMSIVGCIFYSLIYFYLFKGKLIKKLTLIFIVGVTLLFFINGLFLQPFSAKFPTNIFMLTNLLLVILSLLLFKQMLQYPLNVNIVKQSTFWYNIAILFFSTSMFLNMGLLNYYAEHKWTHDLVYYFWVANYCIFNILIAISLSIDNKKLKEKYEY